jgi:hypothetical protein
MSGSDAGEDMEGSGSEAEEEEEEEESEEEVAPKKAKGKKDTPAPSNKNAKQEDGSFKRAAKPNPFKAAIEKREAEKKAIQEARDVSLRIRFSPLWIVRIKLSAYRIGCGD